jgi:hypothetical protein
MLKRIESLVLAVSSYPLTDGDRLVDEDVCLIGPA